MRMVHVGDIAQQVRGVTFSKNDAVIAPRDGYVAVLRAGNITNSGLAFDDLVYVPKSRVSGKQILQPGDIVVAASSGSREVVGKAAQFCGGTTASFGAFLKVVRPSSTVDPSYLSHYFRTPDYRRRLSSLAAGANINNLKNEHISQLQLPLPPLEEQRRIAAILDQADAIRTHRRQVLTHLDALPQAVFRSLFGDPSTWHATWPVGTIDDLAESAQYGTSSPAGGVGDWPVLRMGNLTDDARLDLRDLKFMNLPPADVPKYTVQRGDLLFNRTNSKEKVGKACVVHTDEELAFAGYLVRVRFKEHATADFVATYLTSPHGRAVRLRLAKAAVNQANINAKEMRAIKIAHPPLALRQQFAGALATIRDQREQLQAAQARGDELFASLQSRAFGGEL